MIGYCDVTTDGKGRVCKEVGAFVQWSQSKETTRSSRSTAGSTRSGLPGRRPGGSLPQRSTPGGEKAREKKTECEEGKITLEEYREWLSGS